jgi:hypothetical protein
MKTPAHVSGGAELTAYLGCGVAKFKNSKSVSFR